MIKVTDAGNGALIRRNKVNDDLHRPTNEPHKKDFEIFRPYSVQGEGPSTQPSKNGQVMNPATRSALAHHEAGHAVVDVAGGLVVDGVVVSDQECRTDVVGLGYLEGEQLPGDEYRRRIEPYLIGQLAGGIAERRHTGLATDSGDDDRQNAAWLATKIVPESESLQHYLERMALAAEIAVTSSWLAIKAVASRLCEADQLTREELEEVIGSAVQART